MTNIVLYQKICFATKPASAVCFISLQQIWYGACEASLLQSEPRGSLLHGRKLVGLFAAKDFRWGRCSQIAVQQYFQWQKAMTILETNCLRDRRRRRMLDFHRDWIIQTGRSTSSGDYSKG